MNNRYPNEQQPQQQFYNNSNYNGPHHSENSFNMHQDQQQHPRYPQNRYDLKMNGGTRERSRATDVDKVINAVVYAAYSLNFVVEFTSVVFKPVIIC